MRRESKLLKNSVVFFIGNFASKCLSFILIPIYTAFLGASDFGNINLLLLLSPILAQFFSFEILDGAYRFLIDNDDEEKRNRIITNAIFIYVFGMIAFLIIFLPFALIAHFENAIVFSLHIVLVNFVSLMLFICRGIKQNKTYAAGGVLETLFQGLSNIILIVGLGIGAVSILWAPIIASCVVSLFLAFRIKLHRRIHFHFFQLSVCREMIRYSFPLFLQVLFIWILQNIGNYQLLYITGSSYQCGIYGMVNKYPQLLYSITSIFVLAWQETAVEEENSRDKVAFHLKTYNNYVFIQLLSLAFFIPLLYLYFSLFQQGDFQDVKQFIPIALFSSVLISMVNFISTNYIVRKKTKSVILTSLIPAIISIIISQFLIPIIGIYGIYAGLILGYLLMYFLRKIDISKEIKYSLDKKMLLKIIFPLVFICIAYYFLPIFYFSICTLVTYFILFLLYRSSIKKVSQLLLVKFKAINKRRAINSNL